MSRGPGEMQRSILSVALVSPGLSEHELKWKVAATRGIDVTDNLPASYYSGYRRALSALDEGELIELEPRRLTSLDEVVHVYPSMTGAALERRRREALLPVLIEWARSRGPSYTDVASERKAVRGRHDDAIGQRSVSEEAQAAWRAVEPRLFGAMVQSDASGRSTLLDLVVKGREYFLAPDEYHIERTMQTLLSRARRSASPLVRAAGRAVASELAKWLRRGAFERRRLSAYLMRIVTFRQYDQPTLTKEARELLLTDHRELLRRHYDVEERPAPSRWSPPPPPRVAGLDSLIRKDVKRRIRFVFVTKKGARVVA